MTFNELAPDQAIQTTCYIHPNVETNLRCNKCGQYICARCAVRTPVGYRCKQCINQQQTVFFTGVPTDYVIASVLSIVLGGALGFLLGRSLFFALIFSAPAGGLIGSIVYRATGKRRVRNMAYVVAAGVVIGTIVAYVPMLINVWPITDPADLIAFAPPVLYLGLCAVVAAARFRLTI